MTRRALLAALSVCLPAPAGVAIAQATLPPPPYAVQAANGSAQSDASARMRSAAPVYDRYGGGVSHAPIARAALATAAPYPARTAAAYTGPRMAWGGKIVQTQAADTPSSMAPRPFGAVQARSAYAGASAVPRARLQYPSMAMANSAQAAPVPAIAPETYTPPVYAPAPRQAAQPTSIYDPAPPPANAVAANPAPAMPGPPVRAQAAADGNGPRLYSLHRDYGLAPDPIPLAPQFFGPTADLTAPETPEVGHRTRTSTGALVNAPTDAGGEQ